MQKRNVMRILGAGIIIVVIMGVAFFFIRGKQTEPVVEEQVKQESIFIDENTKTDPADVEIARTWEEVISEQDLWLKTINDTYLHAEPFDDADTLIKVSINTGIDELACCFIGGESMGWSKVVHNGVTGYVNMKDAEYIVEDEEPAEVKALVDEANGVSDSIIDVTPKATPTPEAETTEEAQPTSTPEAVDEEAQPTTSPEVSPSPEADPTPTATPNPNVTTTTTADKQKEAHEEALRRLAELGGNQDIPNDPNLTYGGNGGNGTKYGDLQ